MRKILQKKNILIFITGLLTLALAVFIFVMSQKNATSSEHSSGRFVKFFIDLFIWDFDSFDAEKQLSIQNTLSFMIRKGAHLSEFLVLGLLLTLHMKSVKRPLFLALPIGILYAVSDEIHQYFIPGRSCEFRDMCIDAAGVAIGFLLILVISEIVKRKVKNASKQVS